MSLKGHSRLNRTSWRSLFGCKPQIKKGNVDLLCQEVKRLHFNRYLRKETKGSDTGESLSEEFKGTGKNYKNYKNYIKKDKNPVK